MNLNIHLNREDYNRLIDSVFVFEKARSMYAITYPKGDFISIPNVTIFKRYIQENFTNLFLGSEDFKLNAKQKDALIGELHSSLTLSNQFSSFQYSRDPFAKKPKVIRKDNMIDYIKDGIFIAPFEPSIKISDKEAKEIIDDYTMHFPEIAEVLKWIVACRFNDARRSSYLYLRVNAGFGKTFFISILEDLSLALKVKQNQLKDNTASDLSPASFRNVLAIAIDEFTHFFQELKDITNNITISAKFQLSERVPLYAKIFLSAEKSSSFFGEAGVDSQLAERVNLLDLSHCGRLDDRAVYARNKMMYRETLKMYFLKIIQSEIDNYIKLGRNDANIASGELMKYFNESHRIEANAIEKIKEAVYEVLRDFVTYTINQDYEVKQPTNRIFNELANDIVIDDENTILIKRPTRVFEKVIKEIGDQFAKVAKFKQTDLDEIFGKLEVFKRQGKTIKAIRINLTDPENVPVRIFRPDGSLKEKTSLSLKK